MKRNVLVKMVVSIIAVVILSGCTISIARPTAATTSTEQKTTATTTTRISKKDLANFGKHESVRNAYKFFERNPTNEKYGNITVVGFVVRKQATDEIFLLHKPTTFSVSWDYYVREKDYEGLIRIADYKFQIVMKDDTKNRVLTGDTISVTGILDVKNGLIFDAKYTMIESVE